jgi:hypothetical protein
VEPSPMPDNWRQLRARWGRWNRVDRVEGAGAHAYWVEADGRLEWFWGEPPPGGFDAVKKPALSLYEALEVLVGAAVRVVARSRA